MKLYRPVLKARDVGEPNTLLALLKVRDMGDHDTL